MVDKRKPKLLRPNDLSGYADDVKAFEAFTEKHLRSGKDVEELLREFDEAQKKEWADHIVDHKEAT